MKKLRFIAMMLFGISLLGFNSCLNNDDDEDTSLTSDEKYSCYMQVYGYHTGCVIFASDNTSSSTDTAVCSFNFSRTVQDSSYVYKMTIYGLPIRTLAYNMSSSDCKTAMEEAEDITLECTIDFYSTSPVAWIINPVTPEFELEYGGTTHTIQVPFFVNSYYSIGAYGTVSTTSSTTVKQIQMQVLAAYIYVDGSQTSLLNSYTQFYFEANVN